MSFVDKLDIDWYLDIISVLGNCGGLRGLTDKAVADQQEFAVIGHHAMREVIH